MPVFRFDCGETLINYPYTFELEGALPRWVTWDWKTVYTGSWRNQTAKRRTDPREIQHPHKSKILWSLVKSNIQRDFWCLGLEYRDWSGEIRLFFILSAAYADVLPTLQELRRQGVRIGMLTDAPYGMDREFALEDCRPIIDHVDVWLLLSMWDIASHTWKGIWNCLLYWEWVLVND